MKVFYRKKLNNKKLRGFLDFYNKCFDDVIFCYFFEVLIKKNF